jgi:drug/metabolite transporter (DMT)-like permease
VVEPLLPSGEEPPPEPHPLLGYAMVLTAATLWAVNGTVSKIILETGISSLRLTEVRSTGAFLGLAVALALLNPRSLRVSRRELPLLAVFGICGLAFVQWFYFAAIHRIAIGVALLIQYLAPLIVALWARFVMHRLVRRRIWAALALALVGLSFVLELWSGFELDGLGVAASLLAAASYAVYLLLAEREVGRRDPVSLTTYGFLFAALFWALVQPWWSFPLGVIDDAAAAAWNMPVWALMAWMIVLGTIVPFALMIASLRFVSAPRASIIAMLEPVAATVVAWLWLGETLGPAQLGGGALVLAGIVLAQSARGDPPIGG